jgi:hypothetical protein
MRKLVFIENKIDSFTFDVNTTSYSNIITQNNTNNNSQNNYNFNLVNILILTGVSLVGCSILFTLSYICYKNSLSMIQTDNIVETTASPFKSEVDPTIEYIEEGERYSDLSNFLGQTPDEIPT